mgnify:FL=1
MLANVKEISKEELLTEVQELAAQHYRLIGITGTDTGVGFDLLYHWDKDLELLNLRLQINYEEELPSLAPLYLCAFVSENELQDFLGVKVVNLPINYQKLFLLSELTSVNTPLLKKAVGNDPGEVKPE